MRTHKRILPYLHGETVLAGLLRGRFDAAHVLHHACAARCRLIPLSSHLVLT
jgi:hypothetical protein